MLPPWAPGARQEIASMQRAGEIRRCQTAKVGHQAGDSPVTGGLDRIDMDQECVTRLGALDEDRSRLGIEVGTQDIGRLLLLAGEQIAKGVDGVDPDGLALGDPRDRRRIRPECVLKAALRLVYIPYLLAH